MTFCRFCFCYEYCCSLSSLLIVLLLCLLLLSLWLYLFLLYTPYMIRVCSPFYCRRGRCSLSMLSRFRCLQGMGDSKPDVQMLCHQVVAKVSEYSPAGVLGSLDALIEPLEKTCNKQVCSALSPRNRRATSRYVHYTVCCTRPQREPSCVHSSTSTRVGKD